MEKKEVNITISGKTGTGKSRIAFLIKKVLKENGFEVEFTPDLDFGPTEEEFDLQVGKNHMEVINFIKDHVKINLKQAQLARVSQEENNKSHLVDALKTKMISTYKKIGDNVALIQKEGNKRSFTGNEIAEEIKNETDFGIRHLYMIIALTIDLLSKDKINTEVKERTDETIENIIKELAASNVERDRYHKDYSAAVDCIYSIATAIKVRTKDSAIEGIKEAILKHHSKHFPNHKITWDEYKLSMAENTTPSA